MCNIFKYTWSIYIHMYVCIFAPHFNAHTYTVLAYMYVHLWLIEIYVTFIYVCVYICAVLQGARLQYLRDPRRRNRSITLSLFDAYTYSVGVYSFKFYSTRSTYIHVHLYAYAYAHVHTYKNIHIYMYMYIYLSSGRMHAWSRWQFHQVTFFFCSVCCVFTVQWKDALHDTHTHAYKHTWMYLYVIYILCTYIPMCIDLCMCMCIYMYVCVFGDVYVRTCVYTSIKYIRASAYVCTNICFHVNGCICKCMTRTSDPSVTAFRKVETWPGPVTRDQLYKFGTRIWFFMPAWKKVRPECGWGLKEFG